jgi:uncharacterized protein YecT (DUF1311 family)
MFKTMMCTILVVLAGASAQAAPSFDCKKASHPAEKAICANQELARLDVDIAKAYGEAAKRLDARGRAELKQDQGYFIGARNLGAELVSTKALLGQDWSMVDFMKERVTFLNSVKVSPSDLGKAAFTGEWASSNASVTIKARIDGRFDIEAQASRPVTAGWICDLSGIATLRDGVLSMAPSPPPKNKDDTPDWGLRLTRIGEAMQIEEIRPEGVEDSSRPHCGANGSLEGVVLRTQ